MIKNERQYRITKAQAARFEETIKSLSGRGVGKKMHPLLQKAQADALRSGFRPRECDGVRLRSLV